MDAASPLVELFTIGNEVLAGDVLDTNAHWLCQQCAARGLRVMRVTTLPDRPAVIGAALMDALNRAPALLITTGGLGPTADDLTLTAIADALELPVTLHPEALAWVESFYARLFSRGHVTTAAMTPARIKMAQLPRGSQPLANSVGAAPGVLLRAADSLVACLPGVPAEMKAIFEESLGPRLAERFAQAAYGERVVQTQWWDESLMAPAVDAVAARHLDVYVKSRAQAYGSGVADFITLAARGATAEQVTARLDAAETDLRATLARSGVPIAPS